MTVVLKCILVVSCIVHITNMHGGKYKNVVSRTFAYLTTTLKQTKNTTVASHAVQITDSTIEKLKKGKKVRKITHH